MANPLPFEKLKVDALGNTLVIGPGVESDRFRFDSPPAITSTVGLALDANGYFGTVTIPSVVGNLTSDSVPATAGDILMYNGTSGLHAIDSGVGIAGGALTNITSIDGVPVGNGFVTGPASATVGHLATYANVNGKVIQDASGISAVGGALTGVTTINGVGPGDVIGDTAATVGHVALYSNVNGLHIADSSTVGISSGGAITGVTTINGISPGDVISDSTPATVGHVAAYSNVNGLHIADSGLALPPTQFGNVISDSTPAAVGNLTQYDNANGLHIDDTGIPANTVVTNASLTSTNNALAIYNGTGGTAVQNSTATLGTAAPGVLDLSTVSTGGILLPNPAGSSGAGTTLAFYGQTTSTINWIDLANNGVSLNQPLVATRIGNSVNITVGFANGTLSGTSNEIKTAAGIPVFARPNTNRTGLVGTYNSANPQVTNIGFWVLDNLGVIHLYVEATNNTTLTQWVAGAVGLASQNHVAGLLCDVFQLSYTLDP